MKYILKSKRLLSVCALLLAIVMLFSACGGTEETPDAQSSEATDTVSNEEVSSNAETNSATESTVTQNSSQTSKPTQQQGGTIAKKETVFDSNIYGNIPASVKAKPVHVLMWREYLPSEKKMVSDFQKKTGIKVRTTITTEKELTTKLISLVSAKDAPDVVCISTERFPSVAVRACAPLDAKVFRLDDDCWNKTYMKNFMVNGKYFSVAMNKTWNCEDANYVTYYMPSVLKACGVTTMPWDLYKDGKWDWNAQKSIAQTVAKKSGYIGISFQSWDMMMFSAGENFVKYDGKQYTNNMDSKNLLSAWRAFVDMKEQKLITSWDLINVQQGKVGLFSAIAYGMYNEGNFFTNLTGGYESVNAVPMAGPTQKTAYVPSRAKTWGRGKGSKNPEGAAYFLRYYLDVSNFNYEDSFINKQCKEVFDIITAKKTKKVITISKGVMDYSAAGAYQSLINSLASSTTAQIQSVLSKQVGTVNSNIKRVNNELTRVK